MLSQGLIGGGKRHVDRSENSYFQVSLALNRHSVLFNLFVGEASAIFLLGWLSFSRKLLSYASVLHISPLCWIGSRFASSSTASIGELEIAPTIFLAASFWHLSSFAMFVSLIHGSQAHDANSNTDLTSPV